MTDERPLVIGTRDAPVALWRVRHVAELLRDRHPDLDVEERILSVEKPQDDASIPDLGPRHEFVRSLEAALLAGEIDVAVHGLEDLPPDPPRGLRISAVPERREPRDALVSLAGWKLDEIPSEKTVGTGSLRRRSQLRHLRPDLSFGAFPGGTAARIKMLQEGRIDAVVVALALLQRLEVEDLPVHPLSIGVCVPAPGQGAIAVETREDDHRTRDKVEVLNHPPTLARIAAERSFLKGLGGDCASPVGAYAWIEGEKVYLEAVVGDPEGVALIGDRSHAPVGDAAALGTRAAEILLLAGGREMLRDARMGLR